MKEDTTNKRVEDMAEHVKLRTQPEATEETLSMKACWKPSRIHYDKIRKHGENQDISQNKRVRGCVQTCFARSP